MKTLTTYCAYCKEMEIDLQDRSVRCDRGFKLRNYKDGFKRKCGQFNQDNETDTEERQKDLVKLGYYL